MMQLEGSRHSLFMVYVVKPVPHRAAQPKRQFGHPDVLQEAQVVQLQPVGRIYIGHVGVVMGPLPPPPDTDTLWPASKGPSRDRSGDAGV